MFSFSPVFYLSTLLSWGNSLFAWIKGTAVHLKKLFFFLASQSSKNGPLTSLGIFQSLLIIRILGIVAELYLS